MSKFVLTAQLQLQAPKNTSKVLDQVRNQLQGVKIPVEVKGAAKAQKDIQKLTQETQKASSAAANLGRSFTLAVKRFAAFTIASRAVSLLTNSLANAVDEAIEFQSEIIKVSQVTGKSVRELRGLRKTIDELSIGLGASSKELLSTARILSQAGIKAKDLDVALAALAKTTLAPTFDDITQTAEGAVAILAQFGEGVGALERQLGAINRVAGQFAVESGDLIGAVRRFGGVFKAAGGELEELLGVFTAVRATTRESAESIATGLRTIFTRIQRPKTIEFLRQFGVELQNLDGTFVGPFEAAKRLSEALSGLGEGDITFVRIAEELGGFRQIGKVIPLLQQFSIAENARQEALKGATSLDKDALTAQQALARQYAKVREEFLALVRAITEQSSFQLFAKTALSIASALIKIADAIKPLIPLLATLAAFKVASSLGSFIGGAGSAIRGLQSFDPQRRNSGGKILGFNSGGFVPGSGNTDTVPAMLTPGEFVIRKSSVQKIGASNLQAMNARKYNDGGVVLQPNTSSFGAFVIDDQNGAPIVPRRQRIDLSEQDEDKLIGKIARTSLTKPATQSPKPSSIDFGYNSRSLKVGKGNIKLKGTGGNAGFRNFLNSPAGSEFSEGRAANTTVLRDKRKEAEEAYAKSLASKGVVPQGSEVSAAKQRAKKLIKEIAIKGPFSIFPIGGGKSFDVGLTDNDGNPILRSFQQEITGASRLALNTGVRAVSTGPLREQLNIPPGISGAKVFNFDEFFDGAQESVEGFLLEGVVGAITNAKVGGGGTRFDFPALDGNETARGRLEKLFLDERIKLLDRADAKRRRSTAAASGEGSLANKVGSSLARENFPFKILEAPEGIKQGFNKGGSVQDTVPAMLTPGEFVINKSAAQSIGYSNLNRMNTQGVTGFNKGGAVGSIPVQKFFTGGAVNDVERAQGAIIQNVEQAGEVFKSTMEQVAPEIRAAVMKAFQGIEDIQAGQKGKLAGSPALPEFNEGTRGRASAEGKNTSIGLQLKGAKVAATEETVQHETGHLADLALGVKGRKQGGKGTPQLASQQEGTFQFDLVEKVKPEMEKAFLAAGKSADEVERYLASNEELFAEFFAKASPEVKKIITSTTDSAKGMAELKAEIERAGATYAGLEASDIDVAAGGQQQAGKVGDAGKAKAQAKAAAAAGAPPSDPPDDERVKLANQRIKESAANVEKQKNIVAKAKPELASTEEDIKGFTGLKAEAQARQATLQTAAGKRATKLPKGSDPSDTESLTKAQQKIAKEYQILETAIQEQQKVIDEADTILKDLNTARTELKTRIEAAEQSGKRSEAEIKSESQKIVQPAKDAAGKPSVASRRKAIVEGKEDPKKNKPVRPPEDPPKKKEKTLKEDVKEGKGLLALGVAATAASTALEYLKPQIDENSTAFEKFAADVVGKAQFVITSFTGLAAAAQAAGIQLSFKNVGKFLKGGGGPIGDKVSGATQKAGKQVFDFGQKARKAGKRMQKAGKAAGGLRGAFKRATGGITKGVGSFIARLGAAGAGGGPAMAAAAGALATFAAGALAGGAAAYVAVSAIDAYTGVHEKAKQAIEQGNVAKAGETAVASANTKVANKVTIALAALGVGLIVLGGPVGLIAGGLLLVAAIAVKVADAFGILEPVINGVRDFLSKLGFGPSTATVKQEARLAAARKKVELELASAGRDAAQALERVAAGSSTLSEEFEQGNLTRGLNLQAGVLQEARGLNESIQSDVDNQFLNDKKDNTLGTLGAVGAGAAGGAAIGALIGSVVPILGTALGAAIGGVIGAVGGLVFGINAAAKAEKKRTESLKKLREDEEKFAKSFFESLPTFGNVLKEKILSGSTEEEARAALQQDPAFRKATEFGRDPRQQRRLEQLEKRASGAGGGDLKASEEEELKVLRLRKQTSDAAEQTQKNAIKEAKRQLELIKATNFGLKGLIDGLGATNKRLDSLLTADQSGGDKFNQALLVLEQGLTGASKSLSEGEVQRAVDVLGESLLDAGATQDQANRAKEQAKGFQQAFARAATGTDAFKRIQERLKTGPKDADSQKAIVAEELTRGLDKDVADRITAGIESAQLTGEDVARIQEGDFGPLQEALKKTGEAFDKEVLEALRKRSAAEQALIKATQNRIKSEQEFVEAQRRAIDLQLEAAELSKDFGGKGLTPQEKQAARVQQFNVGAEQLGIGGLRTGSAADITRVANDIGNQIAQQESQARAGVIAEGTKTGSRAFLGAEGVDSDKRERLKALQQDLIAQVKGEIQARKEELEIIKQKNAAEKDALDKLISGDIEGFIKGQAAAGAGAALATGDQSLTGLFSASALGAGFKTLEGRTDITDAQRRQAENLTLGRFGLEGTGVLSGTTTEEQAKKAEGLALTDTLAALGQQAADIEKAEIKTKQAIINAQQVVLASASEELNQSLNGSAQQNRALGGMIYASRGMFVPRGTDTVPAMLTPGEFVVNRSAVQRGNNLQILRAMNNGGGASGPGRMSGGGSVAYYNTGGFVDAIAGAFSTALPGLTTVFNGFTAAVDKLVNFQFNVKLDPTNVNVNFNGGSFLSTLKDDIRDELLSEVGNEIQKYRANTSGDLIKQDQVL